MCGAYCFCQGLAGSLCCNGRDSSTDSQPGGSWATQGAHSPAAAAHDDPWGVPTDDGDYYHLENWSNSDGEDEEDGAVEVLRHVDDPRDDMSDTDEEDQGDLTA